MKWVLLALLLGLCPLFVSYARQPRYQPVIGFALGALPFLLSLLHLYVAPVSFPYWPGHTKGVEVSLIDSLAVAVLIATPRRRKRPPLLWAFIAYVLVTLLTVTWAIDKLAALGYAVQLMRMLLVYLAALRLSTNPRAVRAAIAGGVVALVVQLFYAVQQHFAGALQAVGTLGAQNLLGLLTNLVALPALALLLGGSRKWYAKAGPVMGLLIDLLTASRATIGFGAIGMGGLLVVASVWRWTPRKRSLVALAAAAALCAAPFALKSIGERANGNNVESSDSERQAFKRAAWLMIGDHPAGVGANAYVVISNIDGYSSRAGVVAMQGSRSTNVHNSYLLVMAETGVVSIFLVIALVGGGILKMIRIAFRHRRDRRGDLLIGLAMTLLIAGLHLNYEWAFVIFPVQYLLFLYLGFGVGMAEQITADAARERRAARAARREAEEDSGDDPIGAPLSASA
ncbi:O-antigen ligase [Sphingomonas endophytica]|uniref:O-antigen ligase n=1 Tax=Sphingomonas endophytica TaxID=869719 RepID=A0A7X0MMQ6_9SPHN|nr:O-antigen ligase family protein [Sphingomonas endophytica]MBB6504902.1 O-antigen ligase [Sphingomonas endophytica]